MQDMVVLLAETKSNMKNTLNVITLIVSLVLAIFIFIIQFYYTIVFIIGHCIGVDFLEIKNNDGYPLTKNSFHVI